jgi:hypothetical protein
MEYDYKILEEKYKSLPEDIQLALASTDVSKNILDIAQKHDLFLDQADELSDEVSYVMLGLTKSVDFVKTISKRLEIGEKKAIEVAQDINKEVFDKMRDSLKKIEAGHDGDIGDESGNVAPERTLPSDGERTMLTDAEKAHQESVIAAVEKAGGFIIEKPRQTESDTGLESKEEVLNEIEHGTAITAPDHMLEDKPDEKEAQAASIVDTLLSKGVAMPMDSGDTKAEEKKRPYDGIDPYREAIK